MNALFFSLLIDYSMFDEDNLTLGGAFQEKFLAFLGARFPLCDAIFL
jgi:hypothetical protein